MRILLIILLSLSCSDYKLSDMGSADPGASLPTLDSAEPEKLPPLDTGSDIPEDEPEEEPDPTTPVAICDVTPNPISPPFEVATRHGSTPPCTWRLIRNKNRLLLLKLY